jgi:hypothetical protein
MLIARKSLEDPIRAELFGIERLEQHAESLAAGGPQPIRPFVVQVVCSKVTRTPTVLAGRERRDAGMAI